MNYKRLLLTAGILFAATSAWAEDWTVPITISSVEASTTLTLGVEAGATDGYDVSKDVPTRAYEEELVYARFPHPEWGVTVAGEAMSSFLRDVRGSLPQTFGIEVRSTQPRLTLSWDPAKLPQKETLVLIDPLFGASIDMKRQSSYTLDPGGNAPVLLQIVVSQGDITPPGIPQGVQAEERESTLYLSWTANTESDLAGYKVSYGFDNAATQRTVDVHNVTNYSLFNLAAGETYCFSVAAYDRNGNQSAASEPQLIAYQIPQDEPLSTPYGLSLEQKNSRLILSWFTTREKDLAGYKVYAGTGVDTLHFLGDVGKKSSYVITDQQNSENCVYAVTAYDRHGNESSLSAPLVSEIKRDMTPPESPKRISLRLTKKELIVAWPVNGEKDLAGFRVYMGNTPDSLQLLADVGKSRSYAISDPQRVLPMLFAVTAYDENDNESPLSEVKRWQK